MRADLDDLLCSRYPELFAHRHKPKSRSPICWGFECHDGWFDLINELCSQSQLIVDGGMKQPVCAQVKEKFGSFRFDLRRGANPEVLALIQQAGDRSVTICEVCGQPGIRVDDEDWIRTFCPQHKAAGVTPLDAR